jgi:2-oxoglutarate ferredoxin oxidoreductase subunit beta
MAGLTAVIEEAIRFPGFAFVNVQSPCVTFGEDDWQVKQHKAHMKSLESMGHDPSDQLKALDLARAYGRELYTGVFYRNPSPTPTFDRLVRDRQAACGAPPSPARILDRLLQG